MNFNTVMLGTEDAKALTAFYAKIFGDPQWNDGGFTGWKIGDNYLMIGEHSEVKGRNEMPGRIILNFETPDVKKEFARIKKTGATVVAEPYKPGPMPDGAEFWLATFEDLDGNYFQLASPMPADM